MTLRRRGGVERDDLRSFGANCGSGLLVHEPALMGNDVAARRDFIISHSDLIDPDVLDV
jgi:hypothetical protein